MRRTSDEWVIAVAVTQRAQEIQVERMRNTAELTAGLVGNRVGEIIVKALRR